MIDNVLKLLNFTANDFDPMLSWFKSEKELIQWAGPSLFTWPLDRTQLNNYLARADGEIPQVYIYKAVRQSDFHIVGHLEFDKFDRESMTAVLSRVIIAPNERNKGLGHYLIDTALQVGFEALKLKEIKLSVYTFNTIAIRCYEAAGFKTIGFIYDATPCGNEIWSTQLMSISVSDYLNSAPFF